MRHNKSGRRLGRNSPHRDSMMRNMVASLIAHEKITTTDTRAKELRKLAERMITLGKRGDLHARRQALSILRDGKVVAKLFDQVGPRYKDRPGGYTRIYKLGSRLGDNAPQSRIELVEEEFTAKARQQAPAEPAAKPAPAKAAQAQVAPVAAEEAPSTEEKKEE